MKTIKNKMWLVVVLVIILLASFIPLRKLYYTQKITDKFYNEHYFNQLDSSSEEALKEHFRRIDDNTLRVRADVLIDLDESFKPMLNKIGQNDSVLEIKVSEPYLDKKVTGKFQK